MIVSLFFRERTGLRFNPFVSIGRFEFAADRYGFRFNWGPRGFGYIQNAGWWRHR
ncbi:hypothetical protein [uncultured Sphingopyxis sp.]|jgi:hypothetical protein|uniref:hypothetical protein n=1 Tax=uncultured Sphingopyxis sp. TaxID=310581 RepID=UPI0025940B23|nr:hypothetical protein [uncultured Sphingopyxis sp.]